MHLHPIPPNLGAEEAQSLAVAIFMCIVFAAISLGNFIHVFRCHRNRESIGTPLSAGIFFLALAVAVGIAVVLR